MDERRLDVIKAVYIALFLLGIGLWLVGAVYLAASLVQLRQGRRRYEAGGDIEVLHGKMDRKLRIR